MKQMSSSKDGEKGRQSERRGPACQQGNQGSQNGLMARPDLANELAEYMGDCVLMVLNANQLNILNQVFRPIMCGQLVEVADEYLVLHNVNIKMSNAPEYIFPTDLVIPLMNVVWFTAPFDCSVRFSLY